MSRKIRIRPTKPELLASLGYLVAQAGVKGLPPSKLKPPRDAADRAVFEEALKELIASGEIVTMTKGKISKYFGRDFVPLTPLQEFARSVDEKLTSGDVWLEEALVGTGKKAAEFRRELERLASAGLVQRLTIIVKPGTKTKPVGTRKVAYAARAKATQDNETAPDWPEIEKQARELSSQRFDRTVGFEELAGRLGISTLFVKTAVAQQLDMQAPIQLVEGDSREVSDIQSAGLDRQGIRYLRFRFLD